MGEEERGNGVEQACREISGGLGMEGECYLADVYHADQGVSSDPEHPLYEPLVAYGAGDEGDRFETLCPETWQRTVNDVNLERKKRGGEEGVRVNERCVSGWDIIAG